MKRSMIPIIIAILSALLTIAVAIVQYNEKEVSKRTAELAKADAEEFNHKLIESQNALIEEQKNAKLESDSASKEIIRLNNELIKKTSGLLSESDEAKKKQQETINFILGTDYPDVNVLNRKNTEYTFAFHNNSSLPIYDIIPTIQNYDEIIKCKNIEKGNSIVINDECFAKFSKEYPPFFMAPFSTRKFEFITLDEGSTHHIRILCMTRTKIISYLCVVAKIDGKIGSAIRIYNVNKEGNYSLLKELDLGLKVNKEEYWNAHFFANKTLVLADI
jgi:hypothetical protein